MPAPSSVERSDRTAAYSLASTRSGQARSVSRRDLLAFRRPASRGCASWIRIHRRAMACRFEVALSGADARHLAVAREALAEADRLEAALTVFRDSSELVHVNQHAVRHPVVVSHELFRLLWRCRELHAHTAGAFDITSTPLSRCWGFLARDPRVPTLAALDATLARVGMDGVALDATRRTVYFTRHGTELNLGAIGKGYAVQRIAAELAARGVRHALVSAGGSSVSALGGRDEGWCIDLHSRQVAGRRLARLRLRDGALGTSGAGEQFIEADGTRYGHVLDPRTGWPSSGVLSASVVTRDAASADALATAFLVGGLDLARSYCETHPRTLALITPDNGSARPTLVGSYPGALLEMTEDVCI